MNKRKITTVNGTKSNLCEVRYGVPQGSVLGPILFSLFYSNHPEIIEMYVDDTTIYAVGPIPHNIANTFNRILQNLSNWCSKNLLTPHLGKTEYMLLGCSKFIGPLQEIKFANGSITHLYSKTQLGLEINCGPKWDIHISELVGSFNQKLRLLKAKFYFYFKVIMPSITYRTIIWGLVCRTVFDTL